MDRFELEDVEGWAGHLRAQGYVVVAGALSPEQSQASLEEMWGVMEALGSVRRLDASTWTRSGSWPPMLHGGMIQYLGHTPLQWRLRALCAPVFARYYGVEPGDLATSFDGICMMHSARRYRRVGDPMAFLHTDQSPRRKGEWSIQGLVTLTDSGPEDGGLVVVPGTHLEHEAFFLDHPKAAQRSDWYKLEEAEKTPYATRVRKVVARAGDFLMWDSRTLHANDVPTRPGAVRACAYVCMLPQRRLGEETRRKRAVAFEQRRCSTHHPAEGFRMFPKLPRFVTDRDAFHARVLRAQDVTLTPLQRSLASLAAPQISQQTLL